MAKRVRRVHVECTTASGYRAMKRLIAGGVPQIAHFDADGAIEVMRPDRFRRVLEATECRVIQTLGGGYRRRR